MWSLWNLAASIADRPATDDPEHIGRLRAQPKPPGRCGPTKIDDSGAAANFSSRPDLPSPAH